MDKMCVMINGTGNMGNAIAKYFTKSGIEIFPYSISRPGKNGEVYCFEGGAKVELVKSDNMGMIEKIFKIGKPKIGVDYTRPDAAFPNAQLYCENDIPFVMGTSINGDREKIYDLVRKSNTCAVIAPNMAEETVRMMYDLESKKPGIYNGYGVKFIESHQAAKPKKLSATAKHIVPILQKLGLVIDNDRVRVYRDPVEQFNELEVPKDYLDGHSWHIIKITPHGGGPEDTITYETKINGRVPYAEGTLKAVEFLNEKIKAGETGKVYSMEDVFGLTGE